MKETIDDTEYDDQYEPVEIAKSEGFYHHEPATFYTITLEANFDEEFAEILRGFQLAVNGYTLEAIIQQFLEKENESLLNSIVSFDTENTIFVAYIDTEENQHKVAALIQRLCTHTKVFKKIIQQRLEQIRNRYSE